MNKKKEKKMRKKKWDKKRRENEEEEEEEDLSTGREERKSRNWNVRRKWMINWTEGVV